MGIQSDRNTSMHMWCNISSTLRDWNCLINSDQMQLKMNYWSELTRSMRRKNIFFFWEAASDHIKILVCLSGQPEII